MSTTVTYKGSTLTTVENATKKLTTAGTWLEDDITIQDTSSGGGSVVVVDTPDSHGGTIREITATNTVMLQGQKTVTLTTSPQTITPDTGYDGFASVVVDVGQLGAVTQDENGYLVLSSNGGGGYTADEVISRAAPSGNVITTMSGSIEDYALYGRNAMTSFSAANITRIKEHSFQGCAYLLSVNCPNVTQIGTYCFEGCTRLVDVVLSSQLTTIPNYAFYRCSALEDCDFSSASAINSSGFREASVKDCSFNPTSVADSAFRDCLYWGITKLPNLTTIAGTFALAGIFQSVHSSTATTFVLPSLSSIASSDSISYNSTLESIDIGPLATIQSNTLRENTIMDVLILRGSTMTALANINAFDGSPFASGKAGGTLYVPQAILNDYTSATNWSTILGYTNNQIKSIESTHTDPNAPIDLTLYYADGTEIPTA